MYHTYMETGYNHKYVNISICNITIDAKGKCTSNNTHIRKERAYSAQQFGEHFYSDRLKNKDIIRQ